MAVHGDAPGPGYALVVNSAGYPVHLWSNSPAPLETSALALSGEGALACMWLAINPQWRPDPWPEPGTYVKLPISPGWLRALRREINEVLP